MDPGKKHELVDDLESFLHVVTWVALCFSPHNLSQRSLEELLLRVFDEGHVERSGVEVGGRGKRAELVGGGIAATVKFKDRSKLDSLLGVLAEHLATRYERNIPDGDKWDLQEALLAFREERIGHEELQRVLMLADHQKRMDYLQTSDWMLKQGRDALQVRGDWPEKDNAVDQRADVDVPLRKKRKSTRASAFDPKRRKIIPSAEVDSDEDVLGVDNPLETDLEDLEE
jgi:hypothetical protein